MDQSYFVIASYAVSAFAIGSLAVWILISANRAFQKVKLLENPNE